MQIFAFDDYVNYSTIHWQDLNKGNSELCMLTTNPNETCVAFDLPFRSFTTRLAAFAVRF